jgi:hypothetical protein
MFNVSLFLGEHGPSKYIWKWKRIRGSRRVCCICSNVFIWSLIYDWLLVAWRPATNISCIFMSNNNVVLMRHGYKKCISAIYYNHVFTCWVLIFSVFCVVVVVVFAMCLVSYVACLWHSWWSLSVFCVVVVVVFAMCLVSYVACLRIIIYVSASF